MYPFFVRVDYWIANIVINSIEFEFLSKCFFSLYAHDLVNCFPNVKLRNVFTKFACFYLCEVKKILNKEPHYLST